MEAFNKALISRSAKGRVARRVEPHIKSTEDYSIVNHIFSKPAYTMPEIETLIKIVNDEQIERSSKVLNRALS